MEVNSHKKPHNPHSYRVFLWLLIATVIAVLLSFQIWSNVKQAEVLRSNLVAAQQTNQQVKAKKVELETYVALLNNDDYVLKLARARGFYSLPNEILFNITEQNSLLKNEKAREEALSKKGQ